MNKLNMKAIMKIKTLIITFSFFCVLFLSGCLGEDESAQDYALFETALEESDWSLAAQLAQRILIQELDSQKRWEVFQQLIYATKELGNISNVISVLESNMQTFTQPEQRIFIYEELVEAYSALQQFDKAIETGQNLLLLEGISEERKIAIEFQLLEYALNSFDFENAKAILYSLALKNPIGYEKIIAEYNYTLAFLSENYEDAIVFVDAYLTLHGLLDDEIALALFIKGDCLELLGRYEEAIAVFEESLINHPNKKAVELRIENLQQTLIDL